MTNTSLLNKVGQLERATQDRVVNFFRSYLGYEYLGNWELQQRKSPIEKDILTEYLLSKGYSEKVINKALYELDKIILNQSESLYEINKNIYSLLRYGIKIKEEAGENYQTVWLIDWGDNFENNNFAIAEEVSYQGSSIKRPDIVIYVNGIALGVIELKRSKVSVNEGIRQNLDNQKETFIKSFFSCMQFVMAGNDTEGLRYGTIGTPSKYYLSWKEQIDIPNILDRDIFAICNKQRFLELIYDFVLFEKGTKKLCRPHQYFGVKASQDKLRQKEGGIIWHTQGSGKSLTMVWLAKWIKENLEDSRVLIITDREELDTQIKGVFSGVDEDIYRTKSGRDLLNVLNKKEESLICSLVHKFGNKTNNNDDYLKELKSSMPLDFKAKGNLYVFVDECHRGQSGILHDEMKKFLPNAIFIGFTGTPLLKTDKKKSIEVFGSYIHTYKFNEAVQDGVVLDLRYEARDIPQEISSQDKIDTWFEAKTRGLTDYAKMQIKKKWGTMQNVLSSKTRLEKIASDIIFDFELKPRISEGTGNAILVASSIYEACKYYEIFQDKGFDKCAVVSSYDPSNSSIKGEGDDYTQEIEKNKIYRKMLSNYYKVSEDEAIKKAEDFSNKAKDTFIKSPAQMKLLIVVDKLLTGFDAPPATYLYIDKSMQDHGLFQAITRVNRLDGESKEYGYIIDYKDLFGNVEGAIKDYTGGALDNFDKEDVAGLLTDRLEQARTRLDEELEALYIICEGVGPEKTTQDFIHYFVGKDSDISEIKRNEEKRHNLYKHTSSLVRAYSNIANEMLQAGYTKDQADNIKAKVKYYTDLRDEIKISSGDYVDMKEVEAGMRYLIDSYITAGETKVLTTFDDQTLLDLLCTDIEQFKESLPQRIKESNEAMAETIENNVRKLIVDESEMNPKYFEKMSVLLDELVELRKQKAIEYEEYLKQIVDLVDKVKEPLGDILSLPKSINTQAKKSLYDNFGENEELTIAIYTAIQESKQDDWRTSKMRTRMIKTSIKKVLDDLGYDEYSVDNIMEIITKFTNEF